MDCGPSLTSSEQNHNPVKAIIEMKFEMVVVVFFSFLLFCRRKKVNDFDREAPFFISIFLCSHCSSSDTFKII
jgi:hypothetical protein